MQQRGFTLIELVIVIVILGILAVTAAPRFIDLQGDARASTLQGVKAALQGGGQLVYAKSAIAGNQKVEYAGDDAPTVTISEVPVAISFGYPDADEAAALSDLQVWADLADSDWTFVDSAEAGAGNFAIVPEGTDFDTTEGSQCYVLYAEAADAVTAPAITVESDGC